MFGKRKDLRFAMMACLFSSYAFATDTDKDIKCADALSHVHATVTSRPYFMVMKTLKQPEDDLPAFDDRGVLVGDKSILSLGEGDSSFISTILRYRARQKLPISGIHAVDLSYLVGVTAVDRDMPRFFRVSPEKFPENYHGQRFEDLKILQDGSQRKFDEIISSYSLTYVLERSTKEARLAILEKLIQHAASGAILRAWPYDLRMSRAFGSMLWELLDEEKIASVKEDFAGERIFIRFK